MSRTHRTLRAVACAAVLTLVAGCTSAPGGPAPTATAPTASPSPSTSPWDGAMIAATPAQAQAALGTARAMWASGEAATGDYRLSVTRSCECLGVRTESEVSGGKVTSYDVYADPRKDGTAPEQLPARAADGIPRTIPELLDLVAASTDGDAMTVVFDRFGVPVRIELDPIAGTVDDESSFTVTWSGDGHLGAPVGASPWVEIARLTPIPGAGKGFGTQAVVARDARGVGVYLTMYGSSSCPALPATLTVAEPAEPVEPGPTLVAAAEILFDTSGPRDRVCTADLAPTTHWAPLPAALAAVVPAPQASNALGPAPVPGRNGLLLNLVLTSTYNTADPGVWVAAVTAS